MPGHWPDDRPRRRALLTEQLQRERNHGDDQHGQNLGEDQNLGR
jgi:hypothetical protein